MAKIKTQKKVADVSVKFSPAQVSKPSSLDPNKKVNAANTHMEIMEIIMFKIEGHETWRVSLYKNKQDLERYLQNPLNSNHPKITERKWFIVDKINGTIIEEK